MPRFASASRAPLLCFAYLRPTSVGLVPQLRFIPLLWLLTLAAMIGPEYPKNDPISNMPTLLLGPSNLDAWSFDHLQGHPAKFFFDSLLLPSIVTVSIYSVGRDGSFGYRKKMKWSALGVDRAEWGVGARKRLEIKSGQSDDIIYPFSPFGKAGRGSPIEGGVRRCQGREKSVWVWKKILKGQRENPAFLTN